MKDEIYKYTGSTLSMLITFILHCALKDTRASGSLFQYMIADAIRDHALAVRCWFWRYYWLCRYSEIVDYLYLVILCRSSPMSFLYCVRWEIQFASTCDGDTSA